MREEDERERVVRMREIDREKVMATLPPQSHPVLTLSSSVVNSGRAARYSGAEKNSPALLAATKKSGPLFRSAGGI